VATVRRATECDWRQVCRARLSALADSPSAFGSSLSKEESFVEADWRKWTQSAAIFLALQSGEPVGIVAGCDGNTAQDRRLIALWVHPERRGGGLASDLVACVENWARGNGAQRLTLWVAEGNESARRLYLARGFKPSGTSKLLPSDPAIAEEQMLLSLS
jgi:GNAT superfamily N-acetyltransferase